MSFLKVLREADRGLVLKDCEDRLIELMGAIKQTHGKGKLVLTLSVEAIKSDALSPRVVLDFDLSSKIPHPERGGMTAYITDELTLSARDPRQPQLPGMEEEKNADTAREVLRVIGKDAAAARADLDKAVAGA